MLKDEEEHRLLFYNFDSLFKTSLQNHHGIKSKKNRRKKKT
jgi:hypothetical protein